MLFRSELKKLKSKNEILTDLIDDLERTNANVEKLEECGIFGLAYLVRWQLVENTLSEIAKTQRYHLLQRHLNEWFTYLNSEETTQPKKISNFSIDSDDKIPEVTLVKEFFLGSSVENLIKLITPRSKFRIKRNEVSHSYNEFANQSTYQEYKDQVLKSIEEVINSLTSKEEVNII